MNFEQVYMEKKKMFASIVFNLVDQNTIYNVHNEM